MSWYAHDMDHEAVMEHQGRTDYIIDGAAECGTDNPCEWCPHYMVAIGVCRYGDEFPRCETGRVLRNR